MSQILPGLFLGDIELAKNLETLQYIECRHILCATNSYEPFYPEVTFHFLKIKRTLITKFSI